MKSGKDPFVPGALDLAEEAVHLLRLTGVAALADYVAGTLPFIWGLLYFWSDMSRNPFAAWYCAPAAAGLALLFLWMKWWHVRFCRRLWSALNRTAPEPWPLSRTLAVAARQAFVQGTGMLVMPLAVLFVFPLAWVYAFYQNAGAMDAPETTDVKGLCRTAARQAALWPGQNHVLLSILSLFALFVMAGVAAGLMLLPYLAKWLLGIETAFTVSGPHALLNTTFLLITCALTYVCVDPILKAAYTLRCFYGLSRRTGDDLRAALKPFLKTGLLLLLIWTGAAPVIPYAHGGAPLPAAGPPAYVEHLDRTIEEVLKERRFAWRLPRETAPESRPEEDGWLTQALAWLGDKFRSALETVSRWMEAWVKWLAKHLPAGDGKQAAGTDYRGWIKYLLLGIGALLCFLAVLFVRRRFLARRAARRESAPPARGAPAIDINDEAILAHDLPRDQWLGLARDLMARKDLRRAVRALYLALLAQLGDHGRLAIARYKSNRDYRLELARRAHAEPELLDRFDRCMTLFERAWYGMHPVADDQFAQFLADEERIAALVQHAA